MSVAIAIQHAMRMRRIILSSEACQALPCFSTSSHEWHNFCIKLFNTKCVFWFFLRLPEAFLILRISERDIVTNVHSSSCKLHVIRVRFCLNFLDGFAKSTAISNFIKMRPVGAELFHEDWRTDGRTNVTKLVVAFRNFANLRFPTYLVETQKCSFCVSVWLLVRYTDRPTDRPTCLDFSRPIELVRLCVSLV